jgi:plastocyanin
VQDKCRGKSTVAVSISSSSDGVNFSAPLEVDPLLWVDGFPNANLRQASVDVSSLPGGKFYRLDFFDPAQWNMINEVVFFASGSAAAFNVTEIQYSPGTDEVTLTWTSDPGATYAVKFSIDMTNWDADLDDGIDAGEGETTTRTFDITGLTSESGKLFFRVERN